jgi:CRP-like cAMP-binding protein
VDYDVAAELGQTDLFGSLSSKALNRVAKAASVVRHPAGKAIADQGEVGVGFHLILEGEASVRVGDRERPNLKRGDYFGEISMIDGKPRSANVAAATDLVTASLTRWDVRPLFSEEPEVMWALLNVLCARLRAAEGG